jgi:hypothetical protein
VDRLGLLAREYLEGLVDQRVLQGLLQSVPANLEDPAVPVDQNSLSYLPVLVPLEVRVVV